MNDIASWRFDILRNTRAINIPFLAERGPKAQSTFRHYARFSLSRTFPALILPTNLHVAGISIHAQKTDWASSYGNEQQSPPILSLALSWISNCIVAHEDIQKNYRAVLYRIKAQGHWHVF